MLNVIKQMRNPHRTSLMLYSVIHIISLMCHHKKRFCWLHWDALNVSTICLWKLQYLCCCPVSSYLHIGSCSTLLSNKITHCTSHLLQWCLLIPRSNSNYSLLILCWHFKSFWAKCFLFRAKTLLIHNCSHRKPISIQRYIRVLLHLKIPLKFTNSLF